MQLQHVDKTKRGAVLARETTSSVDLDGTNKTQGRGCAPLSTLRLSSWPRMALKERSLLYGRTGGRGFEVLMVMIRKASGYNSTVVG